MLEASCQPARADVAESDAPTGPFWDYKLPGTRDVVPFIRDFARLGQLVRIAVNDRHFATLKLHGQAEVADGVLSVSYIRQLFNGPNEQLKQQVACSVHEKGPSLLAGHWTAFGAAKVKLGELIPRVTWKDDTAVIWWDNPPAVQVKKTGPLGLMDWNLEASIKEIRIGEFKGRVVFSRKLLTLAAPDLEWS